MRWCSARIDATASVMECYTRQRAQVGTGKSTKAICFADDLLIIALGTNERRLEG